MELKVIKKQDKSMFDYSTIENMINVERWLVEDFLKLNPYNKNRDVDPRVERMYRRLTRGPLPTHLNVSICEVMKPFGPYKVGDIYRNDGNTRSEVWKLKPNLRPNVPLVVVKYRVSSKEEADLIYYDTDSAESVETAPDKVTGLMRERGYSPLSKRIKKGSFKTAVINACRYAYDLNGNYLNGKEYNNYFDVKLDHYLGELMFIDSLNVDSLNKYSGNVLTALLMVTKKYGVNNERIKLLFKNYRDGVTTVSTSTDMDGVHYVYNELYTRHSEVWTQTGFSNSFILISKILYGFDMFIRDINVKKASKEPMTEKQFKTFYQEYFK